MKISDQKFKYKKYSLVQALQCSLVPGDFRQNCSLGQTASIFCHHWFTKKQPSIYGVIVRSIYSISGH